MLHTVNKSPFGSQSLATCLGLAQKGSDVLLIEDGVYGALSKTKHSNMLNVVLDDINVYVLGPDLKARGVEKDRIIEGIKVVDYKGFVELAVVNDKVQSWL